MRRFVPWALLGLLTIGAAAGIALGVADQPGQTPAQWVASALATTAQAGTARFTYSVALSKSNSDPWTEVRGSGLVDFASGDVNATQRSQFPPRTITRTIGIGHTMYVELNTPVRSHWVKLPLPREPQSSLGLGPTLGGIVALSGLGGIEPVAAVREVGTQTIGAVATTRYVVSSAPSPLCPGQHQAASTPTYKQLPTTVWLDQAGRIVQVRSQVQETYGPLPTGTDPEPALGNVARGLRVDSDATLRFFNFGLPVTISAPPTAPSPGGAVSVGTAEARRCR